MRVKEILDCQIIFLGKIGPPVVRTLRMQYTYLTAFSLGLTYDAAARLVTNEREKQEEQQLWK